MKGAKGNIFVSYSQASGPKFVNLKEIKFCTEALWAAGCSFMRAGSPPPLTWKLTGH